MGVDEWDAVNLRDVCFKIGSGATPRGGQNVYLSKGEYTLIRSQNIYNEGFSQDGLVFLTKRHAEELSNVEVQKGDVLLNITGDSVARCCQVDERVLPARVNQHVSIIRSDSNKLDSCFLRYFLISLPMQSLMLSWAGSGGTRNALTKGMIEAFEVPCPPIAEQKAIAHILGTLDDKIELNQQMNQTLEAIARALFKSWFIDFDPVRAKLDGRQPTGMDAETAALFPAEFEDSAIGKIPKGWNVGMLRDCCDRVENGGTPKRSESDYWEPGTIPWLTSGEVRQSIVTVTENFISEKGLANSSAKLWTPRTTVVAMYGATAGQVCLLAQKMCTNQACCGLIPAKNKQFFIYLQASNSVELLAQQARGSAQQNLSQKIVGDFPTVIPSDSVLKSFDEYVKSLFEKWIANLEESKSLASIRDALLPKLLSGEIRVQDAETVVEAVT